jgi:AAA15 family ATPase/GTPase
MILEIRLENFFSIKDEIVLDFRAGKRNSKNEELSLSRNVVDYKGEKILKCIGLFGANASGKSNILKAIDSCQHLIVDSYQYNEGKIFDFVPFKFEGYRNKPSVFLIDFIHDDVEYEYSFTLTTTEILKESLYYYPNERRAKIYTRDETKGAKKQEIYNFADGLIPRPLDVAINTSKKTLFLSRASQMDRELCKKLYRFFMLDFWLGFAPLDIKKYEFDIEKEFFQNKNIILNALSICDSDISDVHLIQERKKTPLTILNPQFPEYPQDGIEIFFKFNTFHKAAPEISFDLFGEESAGTKQLFSMLFFLLDVIKKGKVFMLDEFDLSLHTKLADFIIDLFHASSTAQFVFTSHNTSLINVKHLRRDQILFTNKKDDGSTELYSLYDYKDFRENMDAEKGYLQGRFDAIPIVDTSFAALQSLLGDRETA